MSKLMYKFKNPNEIKARYGKKISQCLLIRVDTTSDQMCVMVPVLIKEKEYYPVAMRVTVSMEDVKPV